MSKFLVNIDLNKNQLQNAVLQPLAITPSNPVEGQFYYNSTDKLMHQWNGTEWVVYGETVNWDTIAGKPDSLVVDANYVHTDNNFTNEDDTKLASIETGAEVNVIETVQVNGTALPVSNKTVNVVLPTPQTMPNAFGTVSGPSGDIVATDKEDTINIAASGIVNITTDAGTKTMTIGATVPAEYVTDAEMKGYAQPKGDYATDTELSQGLATKLNLSGGTMAGALNMGNFAINNIPAATSNNQPATFKQLNDAIAGIGTVFDLKGSVATVADLPATGNKIGDVWFVESESAGYIWLEDTTGTERWEEFGPSIDLSGYLTKAGLLQSTGSATDNAMSQAAITTALGTKVDTADLAEVATSGLYSDLTGTPTIPKAVQIATATIATTATSATVNVNGNIMGVMVFDNVTKAQVMCDVSYTSGTLASRGQVTVSTASAPTNTLNVVVFYIAS